MLLEICLHNNGHISERALAQCWRVITYIDYIKRRKTIERIKCSRRVQILSLAVLKITLLIMNYDTGKQRKKHTFIYHVQFTRPHKIWNPKKIQLFDDSRDKLGNGRNKDSFRRVVNNLLESNNLLECSWKNNQWPPLEVLTS